MTDDEVQVGWWNPDDEVVLPMEEGVEWAQCYGDLEPVYRRVHG